MLKIHLNSKELDSIIEATNCDRYTAMAIYNAKEMGVKPNEMPLFLAHFHNYMSRSVGVLESIRLALLDMVLNEEFMKLTIRQCIEPNPIDISNYKFSNN